MGVLHTDAEEFLNKKSRTLLSFKKLLLINVTGFRFDWTARKSLLRGYFLWVTFGYALGTFQLFWLFCGHLLRTGSVIHEEDLGEYFNTCLSYVCCTMKDRIAKSFVKSCFDEFYGLHLFDIFRTDNAVYSPPVGSFCWEFQVYFWLMLHWMPCTAVGNLPFYISCLVLLVCLTPFFFPNLNTCLVQLGKTTYICLQFIYIGLVSSPNWGFSH